MRKKKVELFIGILVLAPAMCLGGLILIFLTLRQGLVAIIAVPYCCYTIHKFVLLWRRWRDELRQCCREEAQASRERGQSEHRQGVDEEAGAQSE